MEKILVVDDEAIIRSNLERILKEENYQVTSVANGNEALRILTQAEMDVVLLDLNLPDIQGLDVLKKSKELDPELLVIIITGSGRREAESYEGAIGHGDSSLAPTLHVTYAGP